VATFLPPFLISLGYFLVVPGFKLTHEMNNQESLGSVLESLFIVLFGGSFTDVRDKLLGDKFDILLIALPVALAFMVALISIIYRKGLWAKIDMRLSLLFLSILPVYIVLIPLGYFPRYTWSPLPVALIILASVLFHYYSKRET
jgi:hypothetical protein